MKQRDGNVKDMEDGESIRKPRVEEAEEPIHHDTS
jgi:hypothetical protein